MTYHPPEFFWVSWATHPTTISVPAIHLYKSYFCLFGQRYDAVYHSPGRYWYAFGRAYHTNFPVSVSYLHKSYSAFHCFWAGILITKRFLVVRLRTDGSLHYINIILIKSTAMNRSVSSAINRNRTESQIRLHVTCCRSTHCYFVRKYCKPEATCCPFGQLY